MKEIKVYRQQDMILKVNQRYNPLELDYESWEPYIQRLCGDREYQKEAIRAAVLYLAAGNYQNLRALARENYGENPELQDKYGSVEEFENCLQLPDKLYGTIDLATGTGKSYVIYGIAQLMLGLGLVDRVLVLCPSLTIEAGLTEKFQELSGNGDLRKLIPDSARIANPRIIHADSTVMTGDICVENIHAVYERTGSSIQDSFRGKGEKVLVLNDEAHHIFNKVSGRTQEDTHIKKWKSFLTDEEYGFRYILGFTGTAYMEDEYFSDVIYRFSLRDAIEKGMVKNVDYVREDDSKNDDEKFQKIYQNHRENKEKYGKVKPLTILVTKDINKAKALYKDVVDFLMKQEDSAQKAAQEKVLIVTSHRDHRANISRLRYVDQKENPVEWIVSVSMLTEGWDVKNVFQIVPWEDRAFNSKLLVAQVLGRGLRLPPEYQNPQPKVIVFNHRSWSSKIRKLVEEVLEIERRLESHVLTEGDRAQYHFTLSNLNYLHQQSEVETLRENQVLDFSRMAEEGIALESQSIEKREETSYIDVSGRMERTHAYTIRNITWTIEEVLDKLYDEFEEREWEGRILKLGEEEYTQNHLPPREVIRRIIRYSMDKRGNTGEEIVESNAHRILTAFTPLLRKKSKSVVSSIQSQETFLVDTRNLPKMCASVGNLRKDWTVFYSDDWEQEMAEEEQAKLLADVIEDQSLPKSAEKEINSYLFKTPVNMVLTSSAPERKFLEKLCRKENAGKLTAWLKSRDQSFYEIEYSIRYGSVHSRTRKYAHKKFNPDFILVVQPGEIRYVLMVEIKDDGDVSEENRAKYRYGVKHFQELNEKLSREGKKEQYLFHFLSPNGYDTFFEFLRNGTLLQSQEVYRCELENLLEAGEEEKG